MAGQESLKRKTRLIFDSSRCVGCLICQLRCSFRFRRTFNADMAAIKVWRAPGGDIKILVTEECDDCGICERFCPYEAIAVKR